jgi:hypothetical protein
MLLCIPTNWNGRLMTYGQSSSLIRLKVEIPNFSFCGDSIHFQHNVKVIMWFPKSYSVQVLVVSSVYLKALHLAKLAITST